MASAGVAPALQPHQVFEGNRPSMSLLLPSHDPFHLGQLLALYEHRVAVQVCQRKSLSQSHVNSQASNAADERAYLAPLAKR